MPKRSTSSRRPVSSRSHPPRRHVALFPGSFDPVTFGHLDVISRGRLLFDELIVAVGRNPGKDPLFSLDERVAMIRELVEPMIRDDPGAARVRVDGYSGLTIDFAKKVGANVLLRGIRNLSDLQSEVQQALTNRQVGGLETAFVVAGQDFAYTSSSLIRQITAMGEPSQLKSMVPASVAKRLRELKRRGHPMLVRLAEEGRD
ncbi:MAG TPA: pantetheine-phosphate adenylyltransferase [Phycisphaerales bacterium]|nr:pantetheine-phosphate adenylyltransferase [Phycisphaerales bacterium]